jgi:hypothetical protein
MDRNEMWARANDWRTPPEEKKRLLQILHQPISKIPSMGCSKCKKKLR